MYKDEDPFSLDSVHQVIKMQSNGGKQASTEALLSHAGWPASLGEGQIFFKDFNQQTERAGVALWFAKQREETGFGSLPEVLTARPGSDEKPASLMKVWNNEHVLGVLSGTR